MQITKLSQLESYELVYIRISKMKYVTSKLQQNLRIVCTILLA